jgi:hypothetical protein
MAFRIKWRSCVPKLKFLSAALIVAATLAAPATASDRQVSSRHLAVNANASTTPGAPYRGEGDRFADTIATTCGATGAPTTDPCFPQFHDTVAARCLLLARLIWYLPLVHIGRSDD